MASYGSQDNAFGLDVINLIIIAITLAMMVYLLLSFKSIKQKITAIDNKNK